MDKSYPYKLYIGFLFVLFGMFFVLRDYSILSFQLDHFTFILIVIGVALLVGLLIKAERYFKKPIRERRTSEKPRKVKKTKKKTKKVVKKPVKKKTLKRKPRKTTPKKKPEPWGIRKILKRETSEKQHYKRYIKPIEQQENLRR